jgi:hypothetical protein
MRAPFEEKTYETYFNTELNGLTDIFFPLGQVQEGDLGFDNSAFSKNPKLWNMFGYPLGMYPLYIGIGLREIANEMELYLENIIKNIPDMKANLLFQYKRPEYISRSTGAEWIHWNQPYFRYDIYKEQQELLMHINDKFGDNILILYASPAVKDVNELVNLKIKGEIIENSNFKKASELNLHHRNTYIEAGTYSVACSEPKKIENFDLIKLLDRLYGGNSIKENENGNNKQFIINFRKQIESIMDEEKYFSSSFNQLNSTLDDLRKFELYYSFLVMINFRQLTGTQWLVKI